VKERLKQNAKQKIERQKDRPQNPAVSADHQIIDSGALFRARAADPVDLAFGAKQSSVIEPKPPRFVENNVDRLDR
jgi:hypothetical protein